MKAERVIAVTAITAAGFNLQAQAHNERPNIIVILADDMGYSDIGCFGSEIRTPNIDRLATEGITMTQFYNAGRSCPTRAALLTGMYHHKTGVGGMAQAIGDLPGYQGYLNDSCRTVAEVMRDAGYATYMSGKWHIGSGEGQWPVDRGFDRSYVFLGGATNYFYPDSHPPGGRKNMVVDNGYIEVPEEGYYITDAFSQNAVTFIREHDERKPFFMYLSYTAPHWPLQAWPEDIAKYKGVYDKGWDRIREERYAKLAELGIIDERWALSPRDQAIPAWDSLTKAQQRKWAVLMEIYAAMIDRMDYGIGQVLSELERKGQLDNTLLIFLSDNGGCTEKAQNFANISKFNGAPGSGKSFLGYERHWANVSNTPFRFYKHWMYEGGISTPLVARYPEMISPGTKNGQMAHIVDILSTCMTLACVKDHTGGDDRIKPLDGKSLVPLFKGKDKPIHKTLLFEHLGFRALRSGDWKIVSTWPRNEWELYNLAGDRTELNDLSAAMPEKVAELDALYQKEARRAEVVDWNIASKLPKRPHVQK